MKEFIFWIPWLIILIWLILKATVLPVTGSMLIIGGASFELGKRLKL